jgi:hypothetical protein
MKTKLIAVAREDRSASVLLSFLEHSPIPPLIVGYGTSYREKGQ